MHDFLLFFGGELLELLRCLCRLWEFEREERYRMRPAPVPVRRER